MARRPLKLSVDGRDVCEVRKAETGLWGMVKLLRLLSLAAVELLLEGGGGFSWEEVAGGGSLGEAVRDGRTRGD